MYEETEEEIYGCYGCGEVAGEYYYDDDHYGKARCSHCSSLNVVGFTEALDLLLDLERKGLIDSDVED